MLQIANETPFIAHLIGLEDEHGRDALWLYAKATFAMHDTHIDVSPKQQEVFFHDEFIGAPGASSLRYAADLGFLAPGVDVVVNGHIWAPNGQPCDVVLTAVRVGTYQRSMHVHGDRIWERSLVGTLRPSAPRAFTRMPLCYERAFGGQQRLEGRVVAADLRNPVGVGFVASGKHQPGSSLANFEAVENTGRPPSVAGFGSIPPAWAWRAKYAGTYDTTWQRTRAPFLPRDYDPRFMHAAHIDWRLNSQQVLGQQVELVHMMAHRPRYTFVVPPVDLVYATTGAVQIQDAMVFQRLLIEPDLNQFSMLWRACIRADKNALKIKEVRLSSQHVQEKCA